MLKNYLTIALRTLRKQKLYALINASGLALGMACCVLVALFVRDELSFDKFHPNAERIVFIGQEDQMFGDVRRGMSTAYPLADAVKQDIPGVLHASRMGYSGSGQVILSDATSYEEDYLLPADSAFFRVFAVPFELGNPETALLEPQSAVISASLAAKYFGSENPIGKTLTIDHYGRHEARVTAVMADLQGAGQMKFDLVYSLSSLESTANNSSSWNWRIYQTYALLEERADLEAFDGALAEVARRYMGEETSTSYFAVPLTRLYLSDLTTNDGFKGNVKYLYIFTAIALFVLLIACINYMNLAAARSTRRAREVGIRKTLGAGRSQLARQFLGESLVMSTLGFILALFLVHLALPAFNRIFEKELALDYGSDAVFVVTLFGMALVVGLVAGSYPALYLARFQPTETLKDRVRLRVSGAWLRQGLVVVQFAISVFLVAGTLVMYQQLRFVQEKNLGFESEHTLVIEIPWRNVELQRKSAALKSAFLNHPDVLSAAAATTRPGGFGNEMAFPPDPARPEKVLVMKPAQVDYDYAGVLGLEIMAGRFLSEERASDANEGIVLNETAVREMGWTPQEALGKPFHWNGIGTVIGVVGDFHVASLHEPIKPVALRLREPMDGPVEPAYRMILLRLSGRELAATLNFLEDKWAAVAPDVPFSYRFLDDAFDELYRTERRLSQVFASFAGIAIFISCLGLFGMFTFASEQRTKEIGIRKVMGATVSQIVRLLSKDFVLLIGVALVPAIPVAYLIMSRWLENFAYHIELTAGIFVAAGLTSLGIAVATVGYQAVKAALADPVKSLRYE